jgi:predicted DNA-binding protein
MCMKFGTHIRIRITRDLNDRLEQLISKAGSKSDYIRAAIIEKVIQDENEKNRNNRTS